MHRRKKAGHCSGAKRAVSFCGQELPDVEGLRDGPGVGKRPTQGGKYEEQYVEKSSEAVLYSDGWLSDVPDARLPGMGGRLCLRL